MLRNGLKGKLNKLSLTQSFQVSAQSTTKMDWSNKPRVVHDIHSRSSYSDGICCHDGLAYGPYLKTPWVYYSTPSMYWSTDMLGVPTDKLGVHMCYAECRKKTFSVFDVSNYHKKIWVFFLCFNVSRRENLCKDRKKFRFTFFTRIHILMFSGNGLPFIEIVVWLYYYYLYNIILLFKIIVRSLII